MLQIKTRAEDGRGFSNGWGPEKQVIQSSMICNKGESTLQEGVIMTRKENASKEVVKRNTL